MITGKTGSGFEFKIEDEALNDYELFEMLCEIDLGKETLVPRVATRLLGEEQKKALMDHLRVNGRVPADAMIKDVMSIFTIAKELKNS